MLTAARKLVNAGWSLSALNGCNNLIPKLMTEKFYSLTEALYFKFIRKNIVYNHQFSNGKILHHPQSPLQKRKRLRTKQHLVTTELRRNKTIPKIF